ncbi:glycosyltransferase 87 family protein [Microlunatus sp. Y2014]|uniref:glycosyltransferase 87 family protein n=1 Tax=Microlunatus sp. Y2014 TaxID=3418488 RepID=UPI003DA753E4
MRTSAHPGARPAFLPLSATTWLSTPGRVAVVWLLSRLLIGIVYATPAENYIAGDPYYYWRKLSAMGEVGLGSTMQEYPTPAVWVLQLPWLLGFGTTVGYVVAFALLMLACDALLTVWLWRAGGRRRTAALEFWLVFLVVFGPLAYFRFDLLPAVLVAAALLFSAARPAVAGALVGVGAAVKLWPALVYPALLARPGRGRVPTTIGFVVAGFGLALVSLVIGGWERLVSPLTWQSDRGLQIESIPATALMAARAVRPDLWVVELSQYNAYELMSGPGVAAMTVTSSVLTVLGGLTIVLILARALVPGFGRHTDPRRIPDAWHIGMIVMALVLILIITNKTLSPQYVTWLGGPLVYMFLHSGRTGQRSALTQRLAVGVLVLAGLTHLVYPLLYTPLYSGGSLMWLPTLALALRNLGLVILTVWVVLLALRPPRPPVVADQQNPAAVADDVS